MKNTITSRDFIEYPTTSKLTYKNKDPFIRIYKNDHVYYGFYNKDIYLIELHRKPIQSKIILKNAIPPNDQHQTILNQATKQIRGIKYKILYVSNNQYLCIGHNEQNISFVIMTIDLNTKGYFEIQNLKRVE